VVEGYGFYSFRPVVEQETVVGPFQAPGRLFAGPSEEDHIRLK
jgi:hypothetical protein